VVMIPVQLKAARAQTGWSQDDVASAAGVDVSTVVNLEDGKNHPARPVLNDIRVVLEAAGADFPPKTNLPP
jgi:transcriptional regulator with XRE-family HTH domain